MLRTTTGKESREADLSHSMEEANCYFSDEGEMRKWCQPWLTLDLFRRVLFAVNSHSQQH